MADDILRGWNEIAEFLSCDVRTAKRWEQNRHLPVRRTRRTPGEGRPNVHALKSELETWIASANLPSEPAQLTNNSQSQTGLEHGVAPPLPQLAASRWKQSTLAAASIALAVIALIVWQAARRPSQDSASGSSAKSPQAVHAATPEEARAQELYLHGSYLFEQRTPEALEQARLDFEAAIAASSNYAPAYVGLAKTYALLREYSNLPSTVAYPLVRQAAQKAIALDPRLADAHTALAYEEFFWEWDALHAEVEFKQALALDPNSILAHHWYGSMLTHQQRFAEALDQLNQAQILEPDSTAVLGSRAYAIGLSGNRDQAVNLVQDILAHGPDSAPLHFTLAELCLEQPRDIPRYLDQMRRFAELRHSDEMLALLKAGEPAYRKQGEEKQMWQAMFRVEQQLHPAAQHPTYFMVTLEAAQGLKDTALRDLNPLFRSHDEQMIGIGIDPLLSPVRSDPRFTRIAGQVGLSLTPTPAKLLALNR